MAPPGELYPQIASRFTLYAPQCAAWRQACRVLRRNLLLYSNDYTNRSARWHDPPSGSSHSTARALLCAWAWSGVLQEWRFLISGRSPDIRRRTHNCRRPLRLLPDCVAPAAQSSEGGGFRVAPAGLVASTPDLVPGPSARPAPFSRIRPVYAAPMAPAHRRTLVW